MTTTSRARQVDSALSVLRTIDWDFSGYVPSARERGVQSVHWYPAPFPPALAGTLLDALNGKRRANTRVLDPFSGSAVAPIEAWARGFCVEGVDNNWFAIQIARAKVRILQNGTQRKGMELARTYRSFHRAFVGDYSRDSASDVCADAGISPEAARWFTTGTLKALAIAKLWIEQDEAAAPWRPVLRVLLSSLLHSRFSVVRRYHYTYIVDRSRVKAECRDQVDVPDIYSQRIESVFLEGEIARRQIGSTGIVLSESLPRFHHGRARDVVDLVSEPVDIVLTSPPYFGMNDYTRSQYLTWLVFQWSSFDDDIQRESGSRRSRRSSKALDSYHEEMENSFRAIREVHRAHGYLATIIGRSQGGFARKSDSVGRLREMIVSCGYNLKWSKVRRVRFRKINNTPYREEELMLFERRR